MGLGAGSLVLVSFGAIGMMDAVGSASLIVHFRHALGHQAISERMEAVSLRLVRSGMAAVGIGTVADSTYRLSAHSNGGTTLAGMALAAVSTVMLVVLARAKQRVARRIPSRALHADGWLSGVGALLAGVTLAGTALQVSLGWWWLDPAAATAVGSVAVWLSWFLGHEAD